MSAEHSFCGMCGKRAARLDSPSAQVVQALLIKHTRACLGLGSGRLVSSSERLLSYLLTCALGELFT